MAKRISHKNVGQIFRLRFTGDGSEEYHTLLSFYQDHKDPQNNTATFQQIDMEEDDLLGWKWDAYRFKGRWVYGSSADVLVVVQ
jgi:hypothetical protein